MADYKSKIEGDHIILYDDSKDNPQPDIKIFVSGLNESTSAKKSEKAKFHMDRVNNLYKEWKQNGKKILNKIIKVNK